MRDPKFDPQTYTMRYCEKLLKLDRRAVDRLIDAARGKRMIRTLTQRRPGTRAVELEGACS